jgi:hypothetical protein
MQPQPFLPSTVSSADAAQQNIYNWMAQQPGLLAQMQTINPALNYQIQQMNTDAAYADKLLQEQLAQRGVLTGGIYPSLYQQQIATPYARQMQDLAMQGAQQYGQAATDYAQTDMSYLQDAIDALQQQLSEVMQNLPPELPQRHGQPPLIKKQRRKIKKLKSRLRKLRRRRRRGR